MLTWNDESDSDPQIDEEHHKLYRMMNRLEPTILGGSKQETIDRAVQMLYQRMAQHFDLEEELAFTVNSREFAVLHTGHRTILDILGRLRGLPAEDAATRRWIFTEFQAALAAHDSEVDAPLFRMN